MNEQLVNLVLVREIEKRPVIYNYKLRGCCGKNFVDTAWNEVGKAVDMTVSECKVRWKNLRTVLARHIRSGGTKFKKRPYYLYQAMQFAIPYIKVLNLEPNNGTNVKESDKDEETFQDVEIKEENIGFEYQDTEPVGRRSPTPSSSSLVIPLSEELSKEGTLINNQNERLGRNSNDRESTPHHELNTRINWSTREISSSSRTKALRMFLLSLLPDLESMTDNQVREFKRKCLEVVDEILSHSAH